MSQSIVVDAPPGNVLRPQLYMLQVLRFVAALSVLMFHFGSGLSVEFGLPLNYFAVGAAGVDIFFVLSGFIICYSVNLDRGSADFFWRRIARVVPLYWLLTFLLILVGLFSEGLLNSTEINGETIFKSLFFIPFEKSNGSIQPILFLGWTLCYEMYFYFIFGCCLFMKKRASWLASAIIVVLASVGYIWPELPAPWRVYTNPILLEFAIGMLIYNIYIALPRLRGGSNVMGFILLVIAPAVHTVGMMMVGPGIVTSGSFAACMVLAFLLFRPQKSKVLLFFVLLGDASYSLYLIHPYTLQFPIKLLGGQVNFDLLVVILVGVSLATIAISVVMFQWFEKPAQNVLLGRPARSSTKLRHVTEEGLGRT